MELNLKSRSKILNLLLILAVTVIILGLVIDLRNTLVYGQIDLRNRVVGARVLIEGMDPYFFKWHQGMSDRLLDPSVKPNSIISRVSVPPTVLILHSPIASFSYFQQKIIWLIVQWGAFLSTLAIFAKKSDSSFKKNLMLILFWFFFSSLFWHFHVVKGQIYIIYVFLLSLAWFFSQTSLRYHNMLSGILVGLTASLRPPVTLMFIPFLIYRQWTLLWGSTVGLISGLSVSLTLANFSIWKSYFLAVSGMTNLINLGQYSPSERNVDETIANYPKIIEGMSNLRSTTHFFYTNTSFKKILTSSYAQKIENFLKLDLTRSQITIFLLLVTILFIFFCIIILPHKNISMNLIFLSGIVLYLLSEFLIPVGRYCYNDVQWILPLSLIIVEARMPILLSNKLIFSLLFSLLLCTGAFSWIPYSIDLGVYLMALYVTLTSVILIKQGAKQL